jgi:hypothetical protein
MESKGRNRLDTNDPTFSQHYYKAGKGPFQNLSDLPSDEAKAILDNFRRPVSRR